MRYNDLALKMMLIGSCILLIESFQWPQMASSQDMKRTLDLQESVKIALTNNPAIKNATQRILEAKAKVNKARAGFLPQLLFNSSYTRLNEEPTIIIPAGSLGKIASEEYIPLSSSLIPVEDKENFNINFTLQQSLFSGGRIKFTCKQAKSELEVIEGKYEVVKQGVIIKVKTAYYEVLKAMKFEIVTEESTKLLQAHKKRVENLYKIGSVSQNDLLRTEVQLANAKVDLLKAKNAVVMAKVHFYNILGLDLKTDIDIELIEEIPTKFDPEEPIVLNDCLNSALKNRAEVRIMEANLWSADSEVQLANAANRPNVTFSSHYGWEGKDFFPDQENWSVQVKSSLSLFDSFATKARIVQAESGLERIKNDQKQVVNDICIEVRESYLNLLEAEEEVNMMKITVSQAEENFRILEGKYQEGMATNIEVLDAQLLLSNSRLSYYQSLFDYELAMAKLDKAMGNLRL
ncbi:MAG: TolC family protein [bacterium]